MAKSEIRLKKIHDHMATHLKGYVASAVVDLEDGLSMSKLCVDETLDSDAISAYVANIVKSHTTATKIIPGTRATDDISFTTDMNYFIVRIFPEHQIFFYVMTEKTGQLEFKRKIIEKYGNLVMKSVIK